MKTFAKQFEDFIPFKPVGTETIEKYTGKVPDQIISVWKEYGYGSFLNGYLRLINPDEYQEILNETYFFGKQSIPVFTTGMGDIMTWQNNRYLKIVLYRKGDFSGISAGFDRFFTSYLPDKDFCDRNLFWDDYLKAIEINGIPEYDECYGYVPLLCLGGSKKVKNLQKVKIKEQILLIHGIDNSLSRP